MLFHKHADATKYSTHDFIQDGLLDNEKETGVNFTT